MAAERAGDGDREAGNAGDVQDGAPERVNAFEVDGRYLLRHYFEGEAVFERLKPYYQNQQYRFAVPARRFDQVRAFLRDEGYDLRPAEDPRPFAVVVRKYSDHPENVFKAAVLRRDAGDYNCFLLRDRESVALAVKQGATRLVDTDIRVFDRE